MELRVLEYFLAVAREQSISGAAEALHLTQPTLSRQLRDLEEELGKQLFVRGSRRVTLTEDGMLLRRRAEEIVDLVRKTQREVTNADELISGEICVGTGETDGVRLLARVTRRLQAQYPDIRLHIVSGDASAVFEQLDRGLLDFGLVLGNVDEKKYDTIELPAKDVWGVLMRKDCVLARKGEVRAEDVRGLPLIMPQQETRQNMLYNRFLRCEPSELNVVAIYNLIFNASLLVDEGVGYAVTLDRLINTGGESPLCFRPLAPHLEIGMSIVWKKYQVFTKAATKFRETLESCLAETSG